VGEKKKRVGRVNGMSVEVIVMPPIIIRISAFVAMHRLQLYNKGRGVDR